MKKVSVIFIITLQLFQPACRLEITGCTDPLANNYHRSATKNDGSCTYDPAAVFPLQTWQLHSALHESSGLIIWDSLLWTHNDNADTLLYGLEPGSAEIVRKYPLRGVENIDWEEISQDEQYIYLGDFGNNGSGKRKDLHILRIEKNALKAGNAKIDTIWFRYPEQEDPYPPQDSRSDFDCEAMIATDDSIYLFTKQWISAGTSLYSLSKNPGEYEAQYKASFDIQGLVTGACYVEPGGLVVLSAYTILLDPFLCLLYDFSGTDFLSGNKRKISLSLPFHQIEGIATSDGFSYYISNENTVIPRLPDTPQGLHVFDLSPFL